MKKYILLLLGAVLFFGAGFYFHLWLPSKNDHEQDRDELRLGLYKYINPLLDCEVMSDKQRTVLEPLHRQLASFIEAKQKENKIKDAAIYFRDLNNGPWLGINEQQEYTAASLLKVPMLLLVLKLNEFNPNLLNESIVYDGKYEDINNLNTRPQDTLIASGTYSIKTMLEKMIIHSDNKSWKVLQDVVREYPHEDHLVAAMAELGIIMPTSQDKNFPISAKGYSSMFRVLYNSSYLSRTDSELALKLLSQADFDEGLSQGLPPDIILANKFGFSNPLAEKKSQLHDCGIIYYPDNPYLLCVLTEIAENKDDAALFIAEVSKQVYEYWSSNN